MKKKNITKTTKLKKRMSLNEFIIVWQETYSCNYLEKSTQICYNAIIRKIILPRLGNISLNKITTYHLENFFIELTKNGSRKDGKTGGYAHGSICKIKTVLSSILSSAVHWNLIEQNYCKNIRLPKQEINKKIRCFNEKQSKNFIQFINNEFESSNPLKLQYRVLFHIALFGGLRRGELLALQ